MFDGMPNVVIEAASRGLPIIAPNVGGIGEFIENDVTGILLPSLDDDRKMATLYVDAMLRLFHDPELRLRLAANASERLKSMFSSEAHQQAVRELFSNHPATVETTDMARSAESQLGGSEVVPRDVELHQVDFLELQNEALRKQLQAENERSSEFKKLISAHPRELAAHQERIEFLEAQNASLQSTLQTERERLGAANFVQRPDNRLSVTSSSIWFDGRSLPLRTFWSIAKLWQKPRKRQVVKMVLRVLGAKS
jgi:Glycosyl transferases group 1